MTPYAGFQVSLDVRQHTEPTSSHVGIGTIFLNPLLTLADWLQLHRLFGDSGPFLFFYVDPKFRRIRLWKRSISQVLILSSNERNGSRVYAVRIFLRNGGKEDLLVTTEVLEQIRRSGVETSRGPRFEAKSDTGAA